MECLRVVFKDDDPRRLAEDASYAPRRWGVDIIKAYRKKIQVLLAATDERDLYAMRSLRLERLKGNRAGTSSIRLNDQFRLIIKFETDDEGRIVIVIEMVD
ncbi:plasmid maintenance system killer protein [Corynebacterium ulcerans]|nr:type II toxin-antitoxin system RelE/ParE family toxin [Corynebacterium silvaticum]NON70840.1 plasmid maintenance system killer protein [Corynebacterium silvaticum]